MSMTVSVRVAPLRSDRAVDQRNHDLRIGRLPGYIDRDRCLSNTLYLDAGDPDKLWQQIDTARRQAGQRGLKRDARVHVSGVITFGHDAQKIIQGLLREEQDEIYRCVAEKIEMQTGHRVIGLSVHRDESAPHCHFVLAGYRQDDNGYYQPWRYGPRDMSRLQDLASKVLQPYGITRGENKEAKKKRLFDEGKTPEQIRSATIHRTVKELHDDLPSELAELQEKLKSQQEKLEKNNRLIIEQQEKLDARKVDEEKALKRIEAYKRRLEEAEKQIAELDAKEKFIKDRIEILYLQYGEIGEELKKKREESESKSMPFQFDGESEIEQIEQVESLPYRWDQ